MNSNSMRKRYPPNLGNLRGVGSVGADGRNASMELFSTTDDNFINI